MPPFSPRRMLHAAIPARVRAWLRSAIPGLKARNAPVAATAATLHPFDLAFGTDTAGLISGDELSTGTRSDASNTAYYGVSPSVFDQAFAALALDLSGFTFIDLGSGKGRALLLATCFPFQQIIGVELSAELNAIAKANVDVFASPRQRCRRIETHTGDAALFDYPAGPVVVFLYHPFLSPVMKLCLDRLAASLRADPREAWIVYVNPMLQEMLKGVPGLKKVWERTFAYSPDDVAGDRLGGTGDRVAVWRFKP